MQSGSDNFLTYKVKYNGLQRMNEYNQAPFILERWSLLQYRLQAILESTNAVAIRSVTQCDMIWRILPLWQFIIWHNI